MRLAALVIITALLFSPAQATTVDSLKIRSASAIASFQYSDPTGCIFTSVAVIASDEAVRSNDATTTSLAVVSAVRFNSCTGETLVDAIGSVDLLPSQFRMTPGKLAGGTLQASVLMFDTTGSSSSSYWTIDLVWQPAGPVANIRTRFHDVVVPPGGGGYLLSGYVKGLTRDAVAYGSVDDGTTNFTEGVGSVFAFISQVKTGSILVD